MRSTIIAFAITFTTLAFAQGEATHFRKQHTLLIHGLPGEAMTLHITAIRASLGYPDALAWRLFAPSGESAGQGRLEPGQSETVELPPVEGAYTLDADPGMNAFGVQAEGAVIAVDIGTTRTVNVIGVARPLYFLVPEGMTGIRLKFQGEAGSMELHAPDGAVVASRELPQYQSVEVSAPVAPGQGGWWRLDLNLAEDQSITFPAGIMPLVAEAPLPQIGQLMNAPALVDFDLRRTARGRLIGSPGPAVRSIATDDGLSLGFDSVGRLSSVALDGKPIPLGDEPPLLGLFVRDVAADSPPVAAEGAIRDVEGSLLASMTAPGLDIGVQAFYAASGDHISVNVDIENLREDDRALTVYFALPFPQGSPTWHDSIIESYPATLNATCGSFDGISAGANGRHSSLPFGCISADDALALAIPMDYPIIHRIAACPPMRQLYLAVDVALTEVTVKSPNRTRFHFTLYRCDPHWGLRSAAERYYGMFPKLFEKRMPEDGGWVCWGNVADTPNHKQLGFLYHWGPSGPTAVAFDDANGLYSFLYNDSARFFADLGQFGERPTPEQAAAAMRALLDADDPRTHILSVRDTATGRQRYQNLEARMGRESAEQYLRDIIAAVERSAAVDGNGSIQVGYLVNREGWGGTDWWTGRAFCNIDPDIPEGYGQFLLDRILGPEMERYRAAGAEPDGFGLDNFFSNAHTLDFSREHLAACDFPPTFATGDFRPVVTGDAVLYEWTAELKQRLQADGKWLMANTCRQPFCFSQHLLDMNGLEWNLERAGAATRVLAYHKQVVSLPVQDPHYEEPFIRAHLPMGVIPGGYAADNRFAPDSETARIYERYLPIFLRMSAAGWEPIPWAWAGDTNVSIERFGSGDTLLFSLHNHSSDPVRTRVSVDLARLEATSARDAVDLTSGAIYSLSAATPASFEIEMAGSDATVVQVK